MVRCHQSVAFLRKTRRSQQSAAARMNSDIDVSRHRDAVEFADDDRSLVIFYMSSYGNTARMAEEVSEGVGEVAGVRVSLYDLEGGETEPFEEADALLFGSPTINGDAVKPVWDLLSSLAVVNLKGKLGGAFGSYGWSGEAVRMIEDRMRG